MDEATKNKITTGKNTKVFSAMTLAFLFALLLSQYETLLVEYANFFTVDNATKDAEAVIVVLSGGPATRIPKAIELYKSRYGKMLLLTTTPPINTELPIEFTTELLMAKKIVKTLNFQTPMRVVPSLKGGATSTFDEALDLLDFCNKEKIKHLILVTDAFHTRRALYAFEKIFSGNNIKLEIAAAKNSVYDQSNWWKTERGLSQYLLEPIKFVVYLFSRENATFIKDD